MKLLQFLFLFISAFAFSQNDMKARIEFEDAETAFAAEDYQKAITHLNEAEKFLGKWTPKVGYLLIVSLDKVLNYGNPDENIFKILQSQTSQYMQYAAKNKTIGTEKFKEINAVEKKMNVSIIMQKEKNDFDYKNGQTAYENENYEQAITNYKKAIEKGNTAAMANLSWYYFNGKGVSQDDTQAINLLKKAAEKENVSAMVLIGEYYYKTQNYQEAVKWFIEGDKRGSASASYNIAMCYLYGNGVSQNYEEALQYFRKSSYKGNIGAINNIGTIYYSGKGVAKNYQEAMKWFVKAAEKGSTSAMLNIAELYKNGDGVNQDCMKAIDWYLKIINENENKNKDGIYFGLAECYFFLKHYDRAMEWFKKNYEESDNEEYKKFAKNRIAEMYEGGLGIKKDKKLAKEWRNK